MMTYVVHCWPLRSDKPPRASLLVATLGSGCGWRRQQPAAEPTGQRERQALRSGRPPAPAPASSAPSGETAPGRLQAWGGLGPASGVPALRVTAEALLQPASLPEAPERSPGGGHNRWTFWAGRRPQGLRDFGLGQRRRRARASLNRGGGSAKRVCPKAAAASWGHRPRGKLWKPLPGAAPAHPPSHRPGCLTLHCSAPGVPLLGKHPVQLCPCKPSLTLKARCAASPPKMQERRPPGITSTYNRRSGGRPDWSRSSLRPARLQVNSSRKTASPGAYTPVSFPAGTYTCTGLFSRMDTVHPSHLLGLLTNTLICSFQVSWS